MNADDFDSGDEAIEFAHEHMSDVPLDELSNDEIRDELGMLETVLEWEKAKYDDQISARQLGLETALDHDHFDAHEHSRMGNQFLDQRGNLVVLDGTFGVNYAVITHYHYVVIDSQTGEISRPGEVYETTPEDDDTHWIPVELLDAHLDDGTLTPARPMPTDSDADPELLAALAGLLEPYWDAGCSPAAAIDHLFCDGGPGGDANDGPFSQGDWAKERRVSGQQVTGGNVSAARDALEER